MGKIDSTAAIAQAMGRAERHGPLPHVRGLWTNWRLLRLFQTRGWCQGAPARAGNGVVVMPDSHYAAQYCLIGAHWHIAPPSRFGESWDNDLVRFSHMAAMYTLWPRGWRYDRTHFNDNIASRVEDIYAVLKLSSFYIARSLFLGWAQPGWRL